MTNWSIVVEDPFSFPNCHVPSILPPSRWSLMRERESPRRRVAQEEILTNEGRTWTNRRYVIEALASAAGNVAVVGEKEEKSGR